MADPLGSKIDRSQNPSHARWLRVVLCAMLLVQLAGCATSSKWVTLRNTPRNPLTETLGLVTRQGPKATPRTMQLLRRYDLNDAKINDGGALLTELNKIDQTDPQREHLYALAELSYVGAKRAERSSEHSRALELYGSSVLYSYRYLFDNDYPAASNPYDPQFRRACDLYNTALEDTLRMVMQQDQLLPNTSRVIKTASHDCQVDVILKSKGWHPEDFDSLEFVSDFEVHGLRNHYHNFGLGVPLIAIRKQHEESEDSEHSDPREDYYPPALSFPVTAFLRIDPGESTVEDDNLVDEGGARANRRVHAVLELRDPLDEQSISIAGKPVPLETDLSTPLAHYLNQPALDDSTVSTAGLLKPEKVAKLTGLYMLEPFRADKIPVIMVHGLWSSPVTWMEMFNDLRSDPAIRENYQFWFYLYPTGQPFWFSASQMREDMAAMRASLDPERQYAALDQTVLVGHSMGGLVSRLQTVDSRDHFWKTLSDRPFGELQAEDEVRDELAKTFFFTPNASVRRVVTIGTPHKGSDVANDVTRWVGRKIIKIPALMLQRRHQLVANNKGYFRDDAPLGISTSIDSLSPKSPILPVLLASEVGPWVKYHNVVGHSEGKGFTGKVSNWLAGEGDGVVALASAKFDAAESEIVVPSDHVSVHRHPASILEVRRILMEHIDQLRSFPNSQPSGQVRLAKGTQPTQPLVVPSLAGRSIAETLPTGLPSESPSAGPVRTGVQREAFPRKIPTSSTTAGRPPAAIVR
ncbi:esterase/lipase family protein [Adhaeretor mobilis]|uniref:Alpha/beta hydrolase family protein n=1 Tax=Adhaeretor mobilis TaxID=1930276 RepID=A0A517MY58_9BACT|nr:alpha/beta fold hydrolase [Adhaeretor mobilis]QDS99825.1 Alpha/beta hydrolase family protein [Adhaeretor mobilis]